MISVQRKVIGYAKTKILKEYPFYSVDSSSWVMGAVMGKQKHLFENGIITIQKIDTKGKRLDTNKLCAHNLAPVSYTHLTLPTKLEV